MKICLYGNHRECMLTVFVCVFLCVLLLEVAPAVGESEVPERQIGTTPSGARVYLDWQLLGKTPLLVPEGKMAAGSLLVVVFEDKQPIYRELGVSRSLYLRLSPERQYSPKKILLRVVGRNADIFEDLFVQDLAESGFFVHPAEDTNLLEQRLLEVGNRDRGPLLAWARSYFGSAFWIVVRLPESHTMLDLSALMMQPEPMQGEGRSGKMTPGFPPPRATARVIDLRNLSIAFETEIEAEGLDAKNPRRLSRARARLAKTLAEEVETWASSQEPDPPVVTVIRDTKSIESDPGRQEPDGP